MDVGEFSRALERLTAEDVHRIAATLTHNHSDSAADEVEAWRVTLTIDRVLRRTHRTRLAARAASSITHTVLQIAAAPTRKSRMSPAPPPRSPAASSPATTCAPKWEGSSSTGHRSSAHRRRGS